MLAKAVASESGAHFINCNMSAITSKWFGEGERLVRALFALAHKLAPSVIFVDEIDSFLSKRGQSSSEHEALRKMKNEWMTVGGGRRLCCCVCKGGVWAAPPGRCASFKKTIQAEDTKPRAWASAVHSLPGHSGMPCWWLTPPSLPRPHAPTPPPAPMPTQHWDGLRTRLGDRVLVLAATNRPMDLDDAVIRRMPRRVFVPLPDAANRERILQV
jgi:SpoVK/Ycf46/Vps4 family AAA+-type ATPase